MKIILGRTLCAWFGPILRSGAPPLLILILVSSPLLAGPLAYITHQSSNTVSVLDAGTNEIVKKIDVGGMSCNVTFTPDGRRAYVTNPAEGTVSVIDTKTHELVRTLSFSSGVNRVAITPSGARAYITNHFSDTVSVVDITKPEHPVLKTIPGVGIAPNWISITPDGARAYVSGGQYDETVSIIELTSNRIIKTIKTKPGPYIIVFSPNGRCAYVLHGARPESFSIIDTVTYRIMGNVPLAGFARGITISPDGAYAYIPVSRHSRKEFYVAKFDLTRRSPVMVNHVPVADTPWQLAFTPDGKRLYVVCQNVDLVMGIDVATFRVSSEHSTGKLPYGLAFVPDPSVRTRTTLSPR